MQNTLVSHTKSMVDVNTSHSLETTTTQHAGVCLTMDNWQPSPKAGCKGSLKKSDFPCT
jgi:hypothetical protein